MIAYGCAITDDELYERCAGPGIEASRGPDSELLLVGGVGSIFRSYNLLLEQASRLEGLEGFVVLHQDAEIVDPDFGSKMADALRGPDVALVGCAGAVDVRSIAWWEGSVTWASFTHRFDEHDGGELPALSWIPEQTPVHAQTGEVDAIDGFVIGFSPWAVENLRFDESIGGTLHGYDFDICMQARAAGKKVVTADLRVVHHHSMELISEVEGWIETHIKLAEKWDRLLSAPTEDWRVRARRAEAELSATRLTSGAGELIWEHRVNELDRRLAAHEASVSWKITKPLRWLKRKLRFGSAPAPEEETPAPRGRIQSSSARRSSPREIRGVPR